MLKNSAGQSLQRRHVDLVKFSFRLNTLRASNLVLLTKVYWCMNDNDFTYSDSDFDLLCQILFSVLAKRYSVSSYAKL